MGVIMLTEIKRIRKFKIINCYHYILISLFHVALHLGCHFSVSSWNCLDPKTHTKTDDSHLFQEASKSETIERKPPALIRNRLDVRLFPYFFSSKLRWHTSIIQDMSAIKR